MGESRREPAWVALSSVASRSRLARHRGYASSRAGGRSCCGLRHPRGADVNAVIFDLYGTLIGTVSENDYSATLGEMASAVGADPVAFQRRWHETGRDRITGKFAGNEEYIAWVCEHIGVHPDPDSLRGAALHFEQLVVPLMRQPRDDALPTLASLESRRVRLGLISDCSWEHSSPLA